MKKTLLGLGLLPLTILSVGIVASCSSTEEPTVSTLEKEAEKFKVPVVTKNHGITAKMAAATIKENDTPENRLVALNKIATAPTIETGFTMVVNSAKVSIIPISLEVAITITETSSTKTQDVTLIITGFMPASKLEVEASKFNSPVEAKDKTMMTPEAVAKIVPTESEEQKLSALNTIAATVPTLDTGFTMTINSAKVSATEPSTVEVTITITETSSTKTEDVVLRISGFLTRQALLDLEAAKFAGTKEGQNSITSVPMENWLKFYLNDLSQVSKLGNLKLDVRDFPTWDESKYSVIVGVGTVLDATSVQIPFTISTIDEPTLSKEVVMTIIGFKA